MTPDEQFDDAILRMKNASSAAHDAYLDADAALTLCIQATEGRPSTAHGTFSQQMTEMRETIQRLETLIMQQSREIRELFMRNDTE